MVKTNSRPGPSARRCSAALAALLAFAALADAQPVRRFGREGVGAIAYHRESGGYGWSVEGSARNTQVEALKQCGHPRCEVVAKLRNGCGAIANGPKKFTVGKGATRQEAETKALKSCGAGCETVAWACTR